MRGEEREGEKEGKEGGREGGRGGSEVVTPVVHFITLNSLPGQPLQG